MSGNPYYLGQSASQLRTALSQDITALYASAAAAGTVTSIGLASTDLTVSGSPVTTNGSITANLATQAGVAGSYTHSSLTINSKGIVTAAASATVDQTGTFTGTLTGCTTSPTGTVAYVIVGNTVTVSMGNITGTSNSTSMTVTGLPALIQPATRAQNAVVVVTDNGSPVVGLASVSPGSGTITFYRDVLATGVLSTTGFTAAGTKNTSNCTFTYLLL